MFSELGEKFGEPSPKQRTFTILFSIPNLFNWQYGLEPSFRTKAPNDTQFALLDRKCGFWAPGDHSMGPRPHNLGIVAIVSSTRMLGVVTRVDRSHRSQSPISRPGV
ncbi:hypothetical protein NPIL_382111 [Nephila pilipes]|uniref:Uncharacterized protein n=1 Tax=Nephila pilipes TaxID=299642 RepID=A0A8X6PQ50_NEPPI|nr:hypothetical protein NPIL_382111 [Nephila pilipes]